ncbi:MAG: spore maturation protein [Firmicutes bacterium HGW-Firmicutes-14]|nr:MAG: spore maturation protein [Firmicutes bacterium HGW-Firmicutes-14]
MQYRFLSTVGNWFIPLFLLAVFLHGTYKRVPLFDTFVEGAREGFFLAIKLLPYVVGIYVAVEIFRGSGSMEFLFAPIQSLLEFLGLPGDILPLMVVRLMSGAAALGLTSDLLDKFGPDSFAGRLASTLDGCTDTVLYIMALYFASVGIKDPRYSLPVGIAAALSGFVASVIICKMVFS